MYVPVRAHRGRLLNNDDPAKEELHVSIFRLLGFGAVKMSRVCRSGTLTMCEIWPSCETFTNCISITKYALESVSVSSPHCIRSQSACGRFLWRYNRITRVNWILILSAVFLEHFISSAQFQHSALNNFCNHNVYHSFLLKQNSKTQTNLQESIYY